jgi:hypothetical protein
MPFLGGPTCRFWFEGNASHLRQGTLLSWNPNSSGLVGDRIKKSSKSILGLYRRSEYVCIVGAHWLLRAQTQYTSVRRRTLGDPRRVAFFLTRFRESPHISPGVQHRKQRKMLNPVFSIAHMRNMGADSLNASNYWIYPWWPDSTNLLRSIAQSRSLKTRTTFFNYNSCIYILTSLSPDAEVHRKISRRRASRGKHYELSAIISLSIFIHKVEMVSWMTRTALELIGQSGLGFSFDSLTDQEPAHPYAKAVKNFV